MGYCRIPTGYTVTEQIEMMEDAEEEWRLSTKNLLASNPKKQLSFHNLNSLYAL